MQEKTMTTDIAAALLADVPRYRPEHPGVMVPDINGVWVDHRHVLAALTAALDPALSERAGEVLEGVTPGPWVTGTMLPFTVFNPNPKDNDDSGVICDCQEPANARFIAWCREGVPALLAQNAALRAERDEYQRLAAAGELAAKECRIWQGQAEAAEAREERLRGAMIQMRDDRTDFRHAVHFRRFITTALTTEASQ